MSNLTQQYVKECFDYDFDTGKLYLKERPLKHFKSRANQATSNTRNSVFVPGKSYRIFKEAGTISRNRLQVCVDSKTYLGYRIIFLWVHGYLPDIVAHYDGDPTNNEISNLLDSTNAENLKFLSLRSNNKSGTQGVSWNIKSSKWQARITVDGKHIHLGLFDDFEKACEIRKAAEVKHGFHKDHGFKREALS